MKPLFKSIACILSLAALSAAPLLAQTAKKDIIDTAAADGSFKILTAMLTTADMVEGLQYKKRPYTVFAPTDEAFAKLPAGTVERLLKLEHRPELIRILLNHVVKGETTLYQALQAGEVETLMGCKYKVRLDGGIVKFGEATLATADINATNGVIHAIDTVMMPYDNGKYNPSSPEFNPNRGECDETGCTPSLGSINVLKYTEEELNEMFKHTGAKFSRGRESASDRRKDRRSDRERARRESGRE